MAKAKTERPTVTVKGLDDLLAQFKKKFGDDSGSILGKSDPRKFIKWVPVDSPKVSEVFGGQGYPRGRQIEVFGLESSGKTSLATYLAAQCQKYFFEDKQRYGIVAIVDAEHAFDPGYAKSFGLDLDRVIFSQPSSGEEGLEQVRFYVESKQVDLIIIDSVDALQPQSIIDGNFGDASIGVHARLMSSACRKFNGLLLPNDASLVWINQLRTKIGGFSPNGQEPTETTGGKALKFYASVRIEVKRGDTLYAKAGFEAPYGLVSKLKCVKNKVATPFRKAEITNIWGKGYDVDIEYFDYFKRFGLISGSGWYKFTDETGKEIKLQGEASVQEHIKANPATFSYLKDKLKEVMSKVLDEELPLGTIEEKPETRNIVDILDSLEPTPADPEWDELTPSNPMQVTALPGDTPLVVRRRVAVPTLETTPVVLPPEVETKIVSPSDDEGDKPGLFSLTMEEVEEIIIASNKKPLGEEGVDRVLSMEEMTAVIGAFVPDDIPSVDVLDVPSGETPEERKKRLKKEANIRYQQNLLLKKSQEAGPASVVLDELPE